MGFFVCVALCLSINFQSCWDNFLSSFVHSSFENQYLVFLRVAVLHRFYCSSILLLQIQEMYKIAKFHSF